MDRIVVTEQGLFCPGGNFWIDPWAPVPNAIVTHGHSDHARPVADKILTAEGNEGILGHRLPDVSLQMLRYGESITLGDARVSLHPAGHVLGSAQVRIETGGEVWVVSGDYKLAPDPTCAPFEPIRCHAFVTEATFGLPIFRWAETKTVVDEIVEWRRTCRDMERTPILFGYALGKAERLLALLEGEGEGPFVVHGSVESMVRAYRAAGVHLPETIVATEVDKVPEDALVLAPPRAQGTPWLNRFQPFSLALASGWMRVRGVRRRKSLDRGFALSDHADWPGLISAIDATRATRVLVTHGAQRAMVRFLRDEKKLDAAAMSTAFEGELGAEDDPSDGAPIAVHAWGDSRSSTGESIRRIEPARRSPRGPITSRAPRPRMRPGRSFFSRAIARSASWSFPRADPSRPRRPARRSVEALPILSSRRRTTARPPISACAKRSSPNGNGTA